VSAHLTELEVGRALARSDEPAHAAECAACRAALDEARAVAARFHALVRPRTLPAVEVRLARRWWPRASAALTAAIAIAAMLAIAVTRRAAPADVRAKGGPTLQLVALRHAGGDHVFAVEPGAILAHDDSIRFVLDTSGGAWLLVVSVDGAGQVNVYDPYGGERSAPIDPQSHHAVLDGSIVLDDAPGPERVWALVSDRPLALAEVRAQLDAIAAGGPAAIRSTATLSVPDGVQQASAWFEKGPH
jgi:hypothetical protein